ncbi:MAG: anaerobic ribonucleoside-triphosphate reductase activating protein [Bacteroidales bacterium]|nr:anaerobic ribonucleoside-triphosphate reductase activating protein [Bacteroidales bacterium]
MLKCYSYDIVCQEIPDEISLAVNISGCPNRCQGCHSPWLWSDEGKPLDEGLLDELLGRYGAAVTCFCIMGGDADTDDVQRILRWVRSHYPGMKTAWYSGRTIVPENFNIHLLDFIKLGPFIEALGGLKSPETNQALYRIHPDGKFEKCTF